MLAPFGCGIKLVGRTARRGVLDMAAFRAILPEQDAVVLALPLTAETSGLVDAELLASMKDGAVLVNAARGALVDTDALLAETATGRLAAILDVTEPEPLPPGHPLWSAPGVTITPHVSGSTLGFRDRAWRVAAAQIDLHSRGESPTNLVL
jgi:phosphoglycerate dehydrogenase-like enzyme